MTGSRPEHQDPRDVDAEFARMLESEGLRLGPGDAPREPAAPSPEDRDEDDALWSFSADSPSEPPSAEDRARARAAHPSAGAPAPDPHPDDEDPFLPEDFVPPDPDLPTPESGTLWAWTALVGGLVLILVVTFSATLPTWLGALGGLASLGGLVGLLLRVPRDRDDDGGDGAQV